MSNKTTMRKDFKNLKAMVRGSQSIINTNNFQIKNEVYTLQTFKLKKEINQFKINVHFHIIVFIRNQ